ncbi:TRAP transporter small permease subunit [Acuticoccus kandeliae]|uniref:TRAP transporter small permease subunit n=1 Tax=Acuticoccus kandeliae TaxID=2073160 RepID=UPI001300BBF5|nr:TRAP transporter small permease [Acuticoccus kandeliae]
MTRFNRLLGAAFSYVYAAVAVLTFGEVCARYLFNSPTQWTIEIVVLIAAMHYMIAAPQAYADDGHIRITALYDRLPLSAQKGLRIFERIVVASVAGIVGYWALKQAESAIAIGERTGSNFNSLSPTILKVTLVVALGLLLLQALVHLKRELIGGRDGA